MDVGIFFCFEKTRLLSPRVLDKVRKRKARKKWKRSSILGNSIIGIAIFPRHGVIVNCFKMVFQFIGSGEFTTTHQTREHLALVTLVIEIGVPLEAVLILESPRHVLLLAWDATVHAFLRDGSVAKQVQAADRHFLELLRVVAVGTSHEQSAVRGRAVLRRTSHVVQAARAVHQRTTVASGSTTSSFTSFTCKNKQTNKHMSKQIIHRNSN